MDEITRLAVAEVKARYQPHTIIVYGSRARNAPRDDSDIDIACFSDEVTVSKDNTPFHHTSLDLWIYPTQAMESVTDEFLRLFNGLCVLDEKGVVGQMCG